MLLESDHKQSVNYYGTLLIAGLAATVGFGLFYVLNGMNVSTLLGILSPPAYHLRIYDLIACIGLGILAVPFALLFVIMTKAFSKVVNPLTVPRFYVEFWRFSVRFTGVYSAYHDWFGYYSNAYNYPTGHGNRSLTSYNIRIS